jgi:hypothetical protein
MSVKSTSQVLSVNLARVQPNPHKRAEALTGIDKISTPEPVLVRAPGGAGWRLSVPWSGSWEDRKGPNPGLSPRCRES